MGIAFFDLLVDVVTQTVVIATDTPDFHIRASTDHAVSFAAEVNPPGAEFYSDWAIGNGKVFAVGTRLFGADDSQNLYIIPTSDLTTSTAVAGLPSVGTSQTRSVSADAEGNAYVMSQLDGSGIQLDRLDFGGAAFRTPRAISPTGSHPVSAPLPGGQGVAVLYTDDNAAIMATIQAY
jgi:hypothetical protein